MNFTTGFKSLMAPYLCLPQLSKNRETPVSSRIVATSTAKWDARYDHPVPHTSSYYGKCMIAGILSCGLAHTMITPLDVVSEDVQVDPKKYTGTSQGL